MVQQDVEQIRFDFFSRLPIVVEAKVVQVSSDAGILPIRQFDDQIGYTDRLIACLNDVRDPERISRTGGHMLRQRFYGIIAGYEDCNDHHAGELDLQRHRPGHQSDAGDERQSDRLASQMEASLGGLDDRGYVRWRIPQASHAGASISVPHSGQRSDASLKSR